MGQVTLYFPLSEYLTVPENYRGVWTTERWDIPDWENLRKNHMGKRTLMVYDKGTCLLVEGLSLEIVDDSSWKKSEEIKKEIREKYQEYRTEKGHEPHFLECIIRWNDTLETLNRTNKLWTTYSVYTKTSKL